MCQARRKILLTYSLTYTVMNLVLITNVCVFAIKINELAASVQNLCNRFIQICGEIVICNDCKQYAISTKQSCIISDSTNIYHCVGTFRYVMRWLDYLFIYSIQGGHIPAFSSWPFDSLKMNFPQMVKQFAWVPAKPLYHPQHVNFCIFNSHVYNYLLFIYKTV